MGHYFVEGSKAALDALNWMMVDLKCFFFGFSVSSGYNLQLLLWLVVYWLFTIIITIIAVMVAIEITVGSIGPWVVMHGILCIKALANSTVLLQSDQIGWGTHSKSQNMSHILPIDPPFVMKRYFIL